MPKHQFGNQACWHQRSTTWTFPRSVVHLPVPPCAGTSTWFSCSYIRRHAQSQSEDQSGWLHRQPRAIDWYPSRTRALSRAFCCSVGGGDAGFRRPSWSASRASSFSRLLLTLVRLWTWCRKGNPGCDGCLSSWGEGKSWMRSHRSIQESSSIQLT